MDVLKEAEWLTINRVLLELYTLEREKEFQDKTLKVFRMLIPYTKGYFVLFNEKNGIDMEHSVFLGMEEEMIQNYMEDYYEKDYLKYTYDLSYKTMTYRDTDILVDSARKKTEFFREFLRPNNIPFGAGIILTKDSKIFGIINLFRSGELGDFSDKDMYILDILKEHLTNIADKLRSEKKEQVEDRQKKLDQLAFEYGLTVKEKEVSQYLMQGRTNAQISEALVISESTVKKHLYNIYAKTEVKNRLQFMALLDQK